MSITSRFFPTTLILRRYSPTFRQSDKLFTVTDSALDKLKVLQKKYPEKRLRVAIDAGGCHGFQYKFSLETRINEEKSINQQNQSDEM